MEYGVWSMEYGVWSIESSGCFLRFSMCGLLTRQVNNQPGLSSVV